jgi:hypothetical protein
MAAVSWETVYTLLPQVTSPLGRAAKVAVNKEALRARKKGGRMMSATAQRDIKDPLILYFMPRPCRLERQMIDNDKRDQ